MITKELVFAKGGATTPAQSLTLEQARDLLSVCLRFESYVFIKPGEITVENHTLGCYTDFRSEPDEMSELARGLEERLPPANAHSNWLDRLRKENHYEKCQF